MNHFQGRMLSMARTERFPISSKLVPTQPGPPCIADQKQARTSRPTSRFPDHKGANYLQTFLRRMLLPVRGVGFVIPGMGCVIPALVRPCSLPSGGRVVGRCHFLTYSIVRRVHEILCKLRPIDFELNQGFAGAGGQRELTRSFVEEGHRSISN